LYSDGVVETWPHHFVAVFGFDNSSSNSVHPSVNELYRDTNTQPETNPQPAPPATLAAGTHPGAYLPGFEEGGSVTWKVNGETVRADVASSPHLTPIVIGQGGIGVVIGGQTIIIKAPDVGSPTAQTEPQYFDPFNGALNGALSVSPSGAATYTVPIAIPAGVAGMAPNLSLVYNSQGGDGIAGQGWELTGLSAIHRCPKTKVQDGFGRQVSMRTTAFDQKNEGLCLDGKRLFQQGDTGLASYKYKLEQDDHSTITRVQEAPDENAPLKDVWFKVVTKTGETRYYGKSPRTRVVTGTTDPSQQVGVWALERVVDGWGNYFEVHYDQDRTNFMAEGLQVSEILYTGHLLTTPSGEEPGTFAHVQFTYEPRHETRSVRFGSVTLPRNQKLKKIITSAGVYTLDYEQEYQRAPYSVTNDPMLPTRLKSVGYCALDNVTCMKPLVFGWDGGGYRWDPADEFAPQAPLNHNPGTTRGTQFVDINGDGRLDLVQNWGHTGQFPVLHSRAWQNTGQGFVTAPPLWTLPEPLADDDGHFYGTTFADVDGDGLPDLISQEDIYQACGSQQCFVRRDPRVWLNRIRTQGLWEYAPGFKTLPAFSGDMLDLRSDMVVDMNGDGKADIVRLGPGDYEVQVRISTGSGWAVAPENYDMTLIGSVAGRDVGIFVNYKLEDINRDGLPDLVWRDGKQLCINMPMGINTGKNHIEDPTHPEIQAVWHITDPQDCSDSTDTPLDKRAIGDIDGDGFRDMVAPYRARLDRTNQAGTCISLGQSFPSCSCPAECNGGGVTCTSLAGSPYQCTCSCPSGVTVTNDPRVVLATGSNWTTNGATPFLSALTNYKPHAGESALPASAWEDFIFSMADLNGDGLADVVLNHVHPGTPEGRGELLVNNGGGYDQLEGGSAWQASTGLIDIGRLTPRVPTEDENYKSTGRAWVDLDGDGVTDLVEASDATGQLVSHAWLNRFRPPVIKTFPNGLAQPSVVSYAVITTADAQSDGTYTDTPEAGDGVAFFLPPLRVVKSVLAEDGAAIGAVFTTDYQYQSMRAGTDGRGPSGFAMMRAIDRRPVAGVMDPGRRVTETGFAQRYPFTGMTASVRQTIDYGFSIPSQDRSDLSLTRTTYCAMRLDGTDDCSVVAYPEKTTLFVHPKAIDEITYLYDYDVRDHASSKQMIRSTAYTYDVEANPTVTTVRTQVYDETCAQPGNCPFHLKTITNTYDENIGPIGVRHFGKPTKIVETASSNVTSDDGMSHTTEFRYSLAQTRYSLGDAVAGAMYLHTKHVEPGAQEPLEMQTAYTPDDFGNIEYTTECPTNFQFCLGPPPAGSNTPNRVTRTSYDPTLYTPPPGGRVSQLSYTKGRFPVFTENAIGQREYSAYNAVFGTILEKTGPNGIHTCFEYDNLGRQKKQIDHCGTANELTTSTDRFIPTAWDLLRARSVTRTRGPDGVASWAYADAYGRAIGGRGRTFDGGFSEAPTTLYDRWGRAVQSSAVRALGGLDPVYLTTTTYDEANRVTSIVRDLGPIDGSSVNRREIQSFIYYGTTVVTDHNLGGEDDDHLHVQRRLETKNVIGKVQLVQTSVDNQTTSISYIYDAEGNLTDTQDGANHTHLHYDLRGRRDIVQDPDMGEWHYAYDGLGNLTSQRDANLKTVSMTYDKLGRILSRRDDQTTKEAKWLYDKAPGAGKGKLAAMVSEPDDKFHGNCDTPSDYQLPTGEKRAVRLFSYNAFGDLQDETDCVDGDTFLTSHSYDNLGRESVVTYPQVGTARLAVQYNYTDLGFLQYLSDPGDNSLYWVANARDAAGQVTSQTTRNNVETTWNRNPATGWMRASQSIAHADGDTIIQAWANEFDEAGNLRRRLRTDAINGSPSEEIFSYDKLNRLRNSTVNIGSNQYNEGYEIDLRGNLMAKAGKGYTYGAAGGCETGGPHAVCTFDGGGRFQYDSNGNLKSSSNYEVTYNLANKVTRIQSGGNSVDFLYGADGNRVVQETTTGTSIARTVYVGLGGTGKSLYERTAKDGGFEHTQFLYAGGAHGGSAFALKIVKQPAVGMGSPSTSMAFYHTDHLGSVTAVSDEQGHVATAGQPTGAQPTTAGYDPWGARRAPDGRPADPASFQPLAGHREFTGHETIPGVGLVNMNGRVYDPALGRFLSPDPNVQFVADLQSYNRYSYVLNNPLRYTDPTGYYGRTSGNFNASQFAFGALIGIAASGACGYGAAACAAGAIVVAAYTATTMYMSGATTNQIIAASAISFAAGAVGGALGGAIAQGMGGGVGAAMVGGAFSSMTSMAITTAATGRSLGSDDFLFGVISGAVLAGVTVGMSDSSWISKAYSAEAQGGGGSGATRILRAEQVAAYTSDGNSESNGAGGSYEPDAESGKAAGRAAERASRQAGHQIGSVNDVDRLENLDPEFREPAKRVVERMVDKGHNMRVLWGRRTQAENQVLVERGTASPTSKHLTGEAVDLINRANPYPNDPNNAYYLDLRDAAQKEGLVWGGFCWGDCVHNRWDPTHFEAP
jgi:RHS repeat-associated protein